MESTVCQVLLLVGDGENSGTVCPLIFHLGPPTWSGICERLQENLLLQPGRDVNDSCLIFDVPGVGSFKAYTQETLDDILGKLLGQREIYCYLHNGKASENFPQARVYELDQGLDEFIREKQRRFFEDTYASYKAGSEEVASPPTRVMSRNLAVEQAKTPLFNGRSTYHGAPISIYSSAFGIFEDIMSKPTRELSVAVSDFAAAPEFIGLLSEIYTTTAQRRAAINRRLAEFIGFPIEARHGFGSDGEVLVRIPHPGGQTHLLYPMCIVQHVNELGGGDGDSSLLKGGAARKIAISEQYRSIFNICPCPILVITVAGPHVMVSGFVFSDIPIQQALTDYVWLADTGEHQIKHTAKLFHALRQSIKALEVMYTNLKLSDTLDTQAKFPVFTSFRTANGSKISIRYLSQMFLDDPRRKYPLFFAQLVEDDESTSTQPALVVKFPRTYSPEAHSLLAANGQAPKLYHAERLPGGRYVIIMDRIAGISASRYIRDSSHRRLPTSALNDISNAIETLHSHPLKLVFGDLRLPNIILIPPSNVKPGDACGSSIVEESFEPKWRAMLVDFDWTGPETHSRYPFNINVSGDFPWPSGVGPGTEMKQSHDRVMFEMLAIVP